MANPGIVLLVLLAIGITIVVVVLLIWAAVSSSSSSSSIVNLQACTSVNISSLLQIDPTWEFCSQGGKNGTTYFLGCTGDGSYNFVVSPVSLPATTVCAGYCSSPPVNGVCNGPSVNNKTAQQNYDSCLALLNPSTCIPPVPLAAQGTTLYYANSVGCANCDPGVCDCYQSSQCQAVCKPSN